MKSIQTLAALIGAATLLAACATAPGQPAGTLNVPTTLLMDGKVYQQVFKNANSDRDTWEFTSNNEQVKNWQWTSLITITRAKAAHATVAPYVEALKKELNRTQPRPAYTFTQQGEAALASVVYLPSPSLPTYEANAWLIRPVPSCGNTVNVQFARQVKAQAGIDKQQEIQALQRQIEEDLHKLQALDWTPSCSPE